MDVGPAPGVDDGPGDGLELLLLDVHEDDRRPFGGQVQGDGLADPLGGAGHDRNAAFEAFHALAPWSACLIAEDLRLDPLLDLVHDELPRPGRWRCGRRGRWTGRGR